MLTPTQEKEEPFMVQSIAKHSDQHHVKHYSFTQHPTKSCSKEILQQCSYSYT